ncbi:MAG TPA: Uma2 family endonuclease [Gemmatimonadaceae bacterium]
MGMAAATKEWTYEMLQTLPDDGSRYEIIDGELLVSPAPIWNHQGVLWKLVVLLDPYLARSRSLFGVFAPADVAFDDKNVVQPDLFVLPLVDGKEPPTLEDAGSMMLVVEVVSPSTARADRVTKRLLYQRFNVPEYWIIDADARLVDRWRPGDARAEVLSEFIEWKPLAVLPALRLDLVDFFRQVHREADDSVSQDEDQGTLGGRRGRNDT